MKILIVNNNMNIGGIQKSLVNLLNEIQEEHDVTLYLFAAVGELMNDVPKNVRIVEGNKFTRIMGITNAEARSEGLFTFLWRSVFAVLTRIFGIGAVFGILSGFQKLNEEYDAAVSFMQNGAFRVFYGGCNEFVIDSVKAKEKIAFVHCDFLNYEGNNRYNRRYYRKFDKIACVSESTKNRFAEATGISAEKLQSVYNCYDYKKIISLSGEYAPAYTENIINIFSASRISEEKGIVRMVPIFRELKDKGLKFIWRVAGDGPQMNFMKEQIKKYDMENEILLLGMIKNPYPYFISSDLLLVPSYNEAAPMVFGEAKITGIPVLTTATASAQEMIGETGLGVVCGIGDDALKESLEKIIINKLKRRKFSEYTNGKAVSEFYRVIGYNK